MCVGRTDRRWPPPSSIGSGIWRCRAPRHRRDAIASGPGLMFCGASVRCHVRLLANWASNADRAASSSAAGIALGQARDRRSSASISGLPERDELGRCPGPARRWSASPCCSSRRSSSPLPASGPRCPVLRRCVASENGRLGRSVGQPVRRRRRDIRSRWPRPCSGPDRHSTRFR